jgi:hypothetical protein
MSSVYKVLPFRGRVEEIDPNAVANQLDTLINSQSALGWDFYQINSVSIMVSPGCLASLFGAPSFPMSYDMAIFRKGENSSPIKSKEKLDEENQIRIAKEEDPNSPVVIEKKRKAQPLLDKLNAIGYKLVASNITEVSEYWEFEFYSNGSQVKISTFEELEKFTKNF